LNQISLQASQANPWSCNHQCATGNHHQAAKLQPCHL
jgi:hypothetical protein